MLHSSWLLALSCYGLTPLALGSPTPFGVQISTRNALGASPADTHAAIAQSLAKAFLQRRDNYNTSIQLDTSWQDVTLFKIGAEKDLGSNVSVSGDVEVSCKTCYIKGQAVAELNIKTDLNITHIMEQRFTEVENEVNTLITETKDAVEDYIDRLDSWRNVTGYINSTYHNFQDGFDLTDFLPPTLDLSFDNETNLTAIPESMLTFRFEDLDLYMELDTSLSVEAEYTLPLYHSNTPVGISLPDGLEFGILFTVDLILSVSGSLEMTSGLHVKVDDHVALNIELFGDEVSGIDFKGGHFELLPVTVQSADATFTAILRVGARASIGTGDALDLPDIQMGDVDLSEYNVGGGIQVGVYANVAEFKTELKANMTAEAECALELVQEYSLVLGATAGAQVTLGTVTYGPAVDATTAIFYTTMGSTCVIQPTATNSPSVTSAAATPRKRQTSDDALVTTTVTTKTKHLAVQCPPTVTGQCPVSMQTTVTSTETLTATLSGSEEEMESATYPTPTPTTIAPIAFGTNAKSLSATSGRPTTYTPTAAPSHDSNGFIGQAEEVARNHKQTVIGVGIGVGVGVPLIAALIGAIFFYLRRKHYTSVPVTDSQTALARPTFARHTSSSQGSRVYDTRETQRLTYQGT